ncbi:nucleotidyltransferase [Mycoplasmopsis pullorum]|uniref:tRNA(Met) cytidine acetate ligase n=1 Tax=Mycoplasmopsis pullorum TaxID=48003 RepID=A0A1L4FSM0_9BACT|nr:nucleotidyltransferase [Mycoplasmopsis pullorum]APJ38611.1 hypothetical protein BLA55_03030 [Mycoplasmopsis pullorum]
MKKVKIGIVVEYNPFHNGHIYQIQQIKKMFPSSKIIVAMSGKYSQRGEVTCASFAKRKRYALKNGVDKVLKLPTQVSTQAAHIFASESVKILNKQKIDYLVFGSESDDVERLIKIAQIIKKNREQYNQLIKQFLKKGANSFPKATNLALQELSGEDISMPNDILGLEYVKTIIDNDYPIQPVSIKRTIDFHSEETYLDFASATKIRQMLKNNQDYTKYTPMRFNYFDKLRNNQKIYRRFQKVIRKYSTEELEKFKMISEGIQNLFKKHIEIDKYDDFVQECTSRRYTSSRIKRTILMVALKIKK